MLVLGLAHYYESSGSWVIDEDPLGEGDGWQDWPAFHAHRAYRVYTQAAGGHCVGPEMRRTFHTATRQALRSGVLKQLDENMLVPDEKTLYIPGKPPVMMRDIGPRQLSDIPRSEVAELIKNLDLGGSPPM